MKRKGLSGKLFAIILTLVLSVGVNANLAQAYEFGDEVISSLDGKITDEKGQPVEGASIRIGTYSPYNGFRIVGSASTDEEGFYSILNYTRVAGDAVSAIFSVKDYTVIYKVDRETKTLNLQIPEQRATITGKVTYAAMYNSPVEGFKANLSTYLGGFGEGWINIASASSDSEGNLVFSIIPGVFDSVFGQNWFRLELENNYEQSFPLFLGDHYNIADQEIPGIPPGSGSVEGYVTDENDVPVHNAVVTIVDTDFPVYQTEEHFQTRLLKKGNYTIRVIAPGFLPLEEQIEINGSILLALKLAKDLPPVVTAAADRTPDHNGWYNQDVTVSFQATDDDSVVSVDSPMLVSTEGVDQVIEGKATDTAGLTGNASITIHLDKSAPVTTTIVSESPSRNNWYNTDVHVILSSTDNLSGVERTVYSLDNGNTWTAYNGGITVSKEGANLLQYRSFDQAGNMEQSKTLEVNIDKTAPVLRVTLDNPVLKPANHKMVSVKAFVHVIEPGSGLDSVVLTSITSNEASDQLGDGKTLTDIQNAVYGTSDTSFELRAERTGKGKGRVYTVTYTAVDQAGNSATGTATVTVPK